MLVGLEAVVVFGCEQRQRCVLGRGWLCGLLHSLVINFTVELRGCEQAGTGCDQPENVVQTDWSLSFFSGESL